MVQHPVSAPSTQVQHPAPGSAPSTQVQHPAPRFSTPNPVGSAPNPQVQHPTLRFRIFRMPEPERPQVQASRFSTQRRVQHLGASFSTQVQHPGARFSTQVQHPAPGSTPRTQIQHPASAPRRQVQHPAPGSAPGTCRSGSVIQSKPRLGSQVRRLSNQHQVEMPDHSNTPPSDCPTAQQPSLNS